MAIFKGRWILELFAIIIAILFLIPFYFVFINSVKSFADILINGASWPKEFLWSNYVKVWERIDYPKAFWNSLIVTVFSVAGMTLISAMAAYRLARRPTLFSKLVFTLFVAAMVIPFQSIMIPLVQVANGLNIMNSHLGLIFIYWGLGVPLCVFLFQGFIKTIPLELEEAAVMDGCSPYGVFWRVVFPLLKPMTVTVIILQSLWVWNDFLLPSLILQNIELRTIPLANFTFFTEYSKQWDMGLASLVMSITPIIIFFLILQKHVIEGVTAGSVKG
ncbi:carbohydrate ABC transporter permease [Neobacillus rhizosphaerae]|uniref:carbohydrate ABC transporter permease n=1 Tax=Neobacillus rhizosphaerae TaxID=2880965 RepID=UPI003D299702